MRANMQTKPHSIRKVKSEDIPSLARLFDDAEQSQPDFAAEIEDGRLYVLLEGKRLLGAASVTHDVGEAFFPVSKSFRKSDDLLERVGYRGEPIAILHHLVIDPDRQNEGLGSEFLQSLLAKYKGSTWVFAVNEKNTHALSFFLSRGFKLLDVYPELECGPHHIVYRTFKREGLCSAAWW